MGRMSGSSGSRGWMSVEPQGMPGERQVKFSWSLKSPNQAWVRVWWGSGEGQMMVRWSGEVQVNVSGMSGECQISIWAWHWWTWNLLNNACSVFICSDQLKIKSSILCYSQFLPPSKSPWYVLTMQCSGNGHCSTHVITCPHHRPVIECGHNWELQMISGDIVSASCPRRTSH